MEDKIKIYGIEHLVMRKIAFDKIDLNLTLIKNKVWH